MKQIKNIGKPQYKPGTLGSSGYPGLASTAIRIAEYIPKCKRFVEVFAGMGRVCPHITADEIVLNDMSDYAIDKLKGKFPQHRVTKKDFVQCMLDEDDEGTILFMDPPWDHLVYGENNKTFCDRKAHEYYETIMDILPKLKSDWFICSDVKERYTRKILEKSGYPLLDIKSNKKLMGGVIQTRVISNKNFTRYNQETLF